MKNHAVRNMTAGKPQKHILAFTIPVWFGYLFQNFYNIVDSLIVGRILGLDALAAVGSTGPIVFMLTGIVTGLTSGFGILISQAFGRQDDNEIKHDIAMSAYLCVFFAAVLTAVTLSCNEIILRAINVPENLFVDTSAYICVFYIGLPAVVLYNMLAAIARAFGDSKTPLYFLMLSSGLNIILDYLFVAVFDFGVAGAAYATVAAQAISGILCFIYVTKCYSVVHFSKADAVIRMSTLFELSKMGITMALHHSTVAIGSMIIQASLNKLGSLYIATYSATMKIQTLMAQFYTALGFAVATYVGQNYGARKMNRIRQGVRYGHQVIIVYGLIVMALAYRVFPACVKLFAEDPTGELLKLSTEMFHISMWFYIPLGSGNLYRHALQGMGNGRIPIIGGLFELATRAIIIFALFDRLQFYAVCLADPGAWFILLVPLAPYYYWYMKKQEKRFA